MAIKAYVGIMGSGKTYEVVSVVIYNALRRGRRVVSNIAGLNFEAMKASLLAEGVTESAIGELVCVPHEKILDPLFWRTDQDAEKGIEAFIQPGDLLALDEIWRFWNGLGLKTEDGTQKRPDRVMNFFRMHRQMTHPETGVSCDVAIITQDPADIHRSIKGVVEETFQMTKLTAVGRSTRYRVDVFPRTRVNRRPLTSYTHSYDPAKFGFYKSHSQKKEGDADAVEENIDDRGNVLKGVLFKVVLPAVLVLGLVGVWAASRVFSPPKKAESSSPPAASNSAPVAKPDAPPMADDWRLVGYYVSDNRLAVVLGDSGKLRVLYDPPNVQRQGMMVAVRLPDGRFAVNYGDRRSETQLIGGRR